MFFCTLFVSTMFPWFPQKPSIKQYQVALLTYRTPSEHLRYLHNNRLWRQFHPRKYNQNAKFLVQGVLDNTVPSAIIQFMNLCRQEIAHIIKTKLPCILQAFIQSAVLT